MGVDGILGGGPCCGGGWVFVCKMESNLLETSKSSKGPHLKSFESAMSDTDLFFL